MKNTRRNTIILTLVTVLAMAGIISSTSVANTSNTAIKSQGRIFYTNNTDDTSDDVVFDASDLVTIDTMITNGKRSVAEALNGFPNNAIPFDATFNELVAGVNNATTFIGDYYYDKSTEGDDVVRYIRINDSYFLCDKNGVRTSTTPLGGTISVVSKDDTTEPMEGEIQLVKYESMSDANLSAGSAAYIDKSLVLGSGSDNINYRNQGYEDKLMNGELKLVFGDNVNLNVTYDNTYVSSATVNGETVSWTGKTSGSSSTKQSDTLYVQTSESFKLSDYKYFMHTINYNSSASPAATVNCYIKSKTDGTLIQLCAGHGITVGHTLSFYTDLSTVDYDKDEEYYLYFSCSTHKSPSGFSGSTGSYMFSNIIFY